MENEENLEHIEERVGSMEAMPPSQQQPYYQSPPPDYRPPQQPSSRPKWMMPAVIGIILVILFAAFAAVLLNPSDNGDGNGGGGGGGGGGEIDSDGDGVKDNIDAFPNDPTQWADRDGDRYGDNPNGINPDAFPDDPTEWKDSDSDGTGDNADICDDGNGGIRIHIDSYLGDGSGDENSYPDPYFIIKLDIDSDEEWEYSKTSDVYENTDSFTCSFKLVVDLPEDQASVRFVIEVWDDDFWSSDVRIDYRGQDEHFTTIYTRSVSNLPETWTENGAEDLRENEMDCTLVFGAEIVKITE